MSEEEFVLELKRMAQARVRATVDFALIKSVSSMEFDQAAMIHYSAIDLRNQRPPSEVERPGKEVEEK